MGRLSREKALAEVSSPPPVPDETTDYVIRKLGFSRDEFERIMKEPNRSFHDYKTSYPLLQRLRFVVEAAVRLGLVSPVVINKYYG